MKKRGFTLIELIIVIAVIAILAGSIFVAIDPARRLHESRNARRASDVTTILSAIKQFQVDNGGEHYGPVESADSGDYRMLGLQALFCDTACSAVTIANHQCLDLSDMGTDYLARVPQDPKSGAPESTGYYFMKDPGGTIHIGACEAEGEGAGGAGAAPVIEAVR